MRVHYPLVLFPSLGVWAQIESPSAAPQEQTCDPGCYDSYRAFLGDLSETIYWVHSTAAHFSVANTLCSTNACSSCPFCTLPEATHDPVALAEINRESRLIANGVILFSCTSCFDYVDTCRQRLDPYTDETPKARAEPCDTKYMDANWPSCNPPGRVPNHEAGLKCELDVCTKGPLQCRVGGQCERRICKDLTDRNTSAVDPLCKDCFQPWLECIHDTCFPATRDCLGSGCLGIDIEECTARCWGATPAQCQRGGVCEHIEYLDAAKPYEMSTEEMRVNGLSRECNQFRDGCLKTCDQRAVQKQCDKVCDEKYPNGKRKEGEKLYYCKDACKERSCYVECQDKTCCMGPEHCRQDGELFRCEEMSDLTCKRRGWLF